VNAQEPAVRGQDVSSYLMSKGLRPEGDWRGASIWQLSPQVRLLVPGSHEYADSDQLVQAAVATIAEYEARPERDVWRDIAEPLVDAQYFRLHPDTPAGSIQLPAGVKATQGILELMRSAASVAEQGSQLRVEGRRSPRVDSFLHTILLGSAAPGSYVLTARVPTADVGPQQLDFIEGSREISGRTVMLQLHAALDAARKAAAASFQQRGELQAFYESVEEGVSANLCWALRDLGGEKRNQPFEIGFSWARGLSGAEPVPELAYTGAMASILGRAGDELATLARTGDARITGFITTLHDERSGPSRVRSGLARVKIQGDIQTADQTKLPRRTIWAVLNQAQYDEAIEAHRDTRQVTVEGRLATSARRLELRATNFQVRR